ncbi:MAG TPA: hypothetical protein PLO67_15670, partial [Saprospiraceae bacterium]|nr:hypothetical protein [Saprospiraceae bacterium]
GRNGCSEDNPAPGRFPLFLKQLSHSIKKPFSLQVIDKQLFIHARQALQKSRSFLPYPFPISSRFSKTR